MPPHNAEIHEAGPWVQVSRLGSPLFNEVMIPLGQKDLWNAEDPKDDQQFLDHVQHQEVAQPSTFERDLDKL
jgi:hypothetical protein